MVLFLKNAINVQDSRPLFACVFSDVSMFVFHLVNVLKESSFYTCVRESRSHTCLHKPTLTVWFPWLFYICCVTDLPCSTTSPLISQSELGMLVMQSPFCKLQKGRAVTPVTFHCDFSLNFFKDHLVFYIFGEAWFWKLFEQPELLIILHTFHNELLLTISFNRQWTPINYACWFVQCLPNGDRLFFLNKFRL